MNREAATKIGEGGAAYKAGLPYAANPYRGKGTPALAEGWSVGWNRGYAADPARAHDPLVMGYSGPKRHAGHTGTKNRI
jgi:hypothetical protein